MEKKINRLDKILILGCVFVGIVIAIFYLFTNKTGAYAVITVDGKEVQKIDLNVDAKYPISTDAGYNLVVVKGGFAYVEEASCPDHICMNMGKISKTNESIICLPNKMVVMVEKGNDSKVDGVSK